MPARTNFFQKVVAIIHSHIADGAEVEESAMLTDRLTGDAREVDVVIRVGAPYPLVIGIEARASGRPADRPWVDMVLGKHEYLDTDKLVLVSESGFSGPAAARAKVAGVITLAPTDLSTDDPKGAVVNRLRSLWPKELSLTPRQMMVRVLWEGESSWHNVQPGAWLYDSRGNACAMLNDWWTQVLERHFKEVADQIGLADVDADVDAAFELQVPAPGEPDAEWDVFVGTGEGVELALTRLLGIRVHGNARIRVHEMTLRHQRLGDVSYSVGEVEMAGEKTMAVVTEDASGVKLTVHPSPRKH